MDRHRKFIKRMKDAKALTIQRFKAVPENASIRKEYIKCGKNSCEMSHGPYYYAYWKQGIPSSDNQSVTIWKLKKKYIGSYLPETASKDNSRLFRSLESLFNLGSNSWQIIPVNFQKRHTQMLEWTYTLMSKRFIKIHPSFSN